ncbi:hypothetical protein [Roseovarius sp. 2305UL8-3]|uniref:hypothetical protein n=1 Tax=Roseovarius conchicola TaxID=3121636 RepID=UPI0035298D22
MLDWILIMIALAFGYAGGEGGGDSSAPAIGLGLDESVVIGEDVIIGEGVSIGKSFEAEPQTPTGRFTTATEVKPILEMTKANWVAVRDFNGQDLLYVTHIWSWRCGLLQMRYAINDGEMQEWPLPPCHEGTNAPNAIIESDGLPYATFAPGSIQQVRVELLFDDLSEASASFTRSDVLMP